MKLFNRLTACVGVFAALAAPVLASPNGVWELDTRDTRISLETCGDGTQLCGTLVWLSDADYNKRYERFLGTSMAEGLDADGANRWKGDMRMFGYDLAGTLTQTGSDVMVLKGCAFLVVCKSYELYRHSE